MGKDETLYCRPGEHWFTRPMVRGRKPAACPVHAAPGQSGATNPDEEGDPIFSEEQLAQDKALRAAGFPDPSFNDLKRQLERFGPDGVLDSARHLPANQYRRLEEMVKKAPGQRRVQRRRARAAR